MSVLLNSKDAALTQAFRDSDSKTGGGGGGDNSQSGGNAAAQGFLELQRTLVAFIRTLPGNDKCCDCGSNNGEAYTVGGKICGKGGITMGGIEQWPPP